MPRQPIAFPLSSNPARFGHAGDARLINVYPERLGTDAKAPWVWLACDGFSSFATLTDSGGVRSMLALSESDLYVVAGRVLWRVDGTGTASILGGVSSDGLVTMARNRVGQIAIVCDGLYYVVNAGVLSAIADPDLPPPTSVTHLDGYFVFLLQDGRFFASEIDGTDVDALDTATAEANPDGGVRAATRGRDLVLFGQRTTEFWANTGGEFPFSRTTANDLGCKAAGSVVELEQTLFWVCHDGTVRRLDGYQGQRISTQAVERWISQEDHPEAITGCAWQSRGHSFYCLSGNEGSWCFDASTGQWHERQSKALDRWRVSQTVSLGNRIVAGDYTSGLLYTLSPDVYNEAGAEMTCTIQLPPTYANGNRVRHNRIDVDVVPGTGLVMQDYDATTSGGQSAGSLYWWLPFWRTLTTSGVETITSDYRHLTQPSVMLDYSDDGGENWSTQRLRSTGRAGQRLTRVFATRLGMSRARTYRISMSAAVARGFVGMTADVDGARS